MTRAEINAIGTMLSSLRHDNEAAVTVAFTAHGPSTDCRNGSVSVTVEAGGHSATEEAVSLADALALARARLVSDAKKREAVKAQDDADKLEQQSW